MPPSLLLDVVPSRLQPPDPAVFAARVDALIEAIRAAEEVVPVAGPYGDRLAAELAHRRRLLQMLAGDVR